MNGATLKRWREERNLSKAEAAERLGIGRNTYAAYERGAKPIPKTVALACAALAFHLRPME